MGGADEPAGTRTDCAIEARGVVKVFGGGRDAFRALDGVSLRVRPNEFFTLLGPSGCGKTTLLRLIAGFEYPSEGSILLDGEDIGALPPYRRPINTVFQNYALFPHMSVARNVGFGLEMQGRPRGEIERRVGEVLELVRMQDLAKRSTAEISGGQQQRVALARALAPSPRVLLLDEPLSALDYKLRKGMQIELKRMQLESGITFVFVTHDQEEALSMSDRLAVMSAGRVLQVGTPRAIYERPALRFVADFIGESNLLEGVVESVTADSAMLRLTSGATITVGRDAGEDGADEGNAGEGGAPPRTGERRGVLVRPEHADLIAGGIGSDADGPGGRHGRDGADPAATVLEATLEHVVYSGTDTQRHVRLADGTPFVLRAQNRPSMDAARDEPGTAVRVRIPARSARLLED